MEKGWIKLHRKILSSDIWKDVTAFRIFVYLILNATHDGTRINGIELKKGQFIRSYRQIAKDLEYREGRGIKQYSVSTIKRNIDKLVSAGRIKVDETEHGTLFTVLNYTKYQGLTDSLNDMRNDMRNELGTPKRDIGSISGTYDGTPTTHAEHATNQGFSDITRDLRNTQRNEGGTANGVMRNKSKNVFKQDITSNSNNNSEIESTINPYSFYENNIGILTPIVMEQIRAWEEDLSPEIVVRAMQEAVYKNVRNWSYINSILRNWADKGAKTLKDVEHITNEFKEKRKIKVIDGGVRREKPKTSYESDSSKYDFSKRRGL